MGQYDPDFVAARRFEEFANDLLDLDIDTAVTLLRAYKNGLLALDPATDEWIDRWEEDQRIVKGLAANDRSSGTDEAA